MTYELWTQVDDYFGEHFVQHDQGLANALHASNQADLPPINVAPNQGKLLYLLAKMSRAQRILEIGTLGGYSTIWLAQALPSDGQLISLELDPHHAEVAKANIKHAGLDQLVTIRVGDATQSLAELYAANGQPFDFIFIDADKQNYPTYLEWAIKLAQAGTVIICDNVVRNGDILDQSSADERVQGVQKLITMIAQNPRLDATAIQTVGAKGYDGFAMITVLPE